MNLTAFIVGFRLRCILLICACSSLSIDGLRLSQDITPAPHQLDDNQSYIAKPENGSCRSLFIDHLTDYRLGNDLGQIFLALIRAPSYSACSLSFNASLVNESVNDILDIANQTVSLTDHRSRAVAVSQQYAYGPPDLWWDVKTEDPVGVANARQMMLKYIAPYKQPCPKADYDFSDAVVMHMRSGDVFTHPGIIHTAFHGQPPCSFYTDIMKTGNGGSGFGKAIILTGPEMNNPCVYEMKKQFDKQILIQSGTAKEDACLMMSAPKVALSMSSFACMLMNLNEHVTDVFVPFAEDNGTFYPPKFEPWWKDYCVSEVALPYRQHLYSFPGYHPGHMDQLVHYPVEKWQKLLRRTIEAVPEAIGH